LQCTSKNTYVGSDHKNKKTEYGNLPWKVLVHGTLCTSLHLGKGE
jgi:hypothetical protein